MIRIEGLKKTYPNVTPLRDVNVTINDGDVVSVIGPSGTGKSTLLRCINLLEKPTQGHIWIGEDEITSPGTDLNMVRRKVGMVFQSFNLFNHLSVIENVMLSPVKLLKMNKQEAYDNAYRLLKEVGLSEKADSYPDELSGGQKQRIAIVRTLAMNPDVILMDEPTSALDPSMVDDVQSVIRRLSKTGKTLMIVTHEMDFAKSISNRVFYMDEGVIYEEGTPDEIFNNPKKEKTRQFIKRIRVLTFDIDKYSQFNDIFSRLMMYCSDNAIEKSTYLHIRLALEEAVFHNILETRYEYKIHAQVEYSSENDKVLLMLDYSGDKYNVLEEGNELSLKCMSFAISDTEYYYDDNGNHLKLYIK
ncbi:MAG: amino acid ABC transporter ATP-binding protein [Lachnospiraceae bacterium]|nr:amino acid ABC transporter ATP-binding protein [Lachnospiraceae bacterium]